MLEKDVMVQHMLNVKEFVGLCRHIHIVRIDRCEHRYTEQSQREAVFQSGHISHNRPHVAMVTHQAQIHMITVGFVAVFECFSLYMMNWQCKATALQPSVL